VFADDSYEPLSLLESAFREWSQAIVSCPFRTLSGMSMAKKKNRHIETVANLSSVFDATKEEFTRTSCLQ